MIGLLYKDISTSKKFVLLTWLITLAFALCQFISPIDIEMAVLLVVFFSHSVLLGRFFQAEEKNNTMILLKTLPIPYSVIVIEKYVLCQITSLSALLIFFFSSVLLPGVGIDSWSGISFIYLFFVIVFGTSIDSVGIFISLWWGSKYLNIVVFGLYLLTLAAIKFVLPNLTIPETTLQNIFLIALPILCVVLYLLSVYAVKTRNFIRD